MSVKLRYSLFSASAFLLALSSSIGMAFGQVSASSSVKDHPLGEQTKRLPKHFSDGSDLPNGWRITPAGRAVGEMGDLVLNLISSPDGKVVISVNSGFLPHAIDVFDAKTQKKVQHIGLTSAWMGMAWSSDGRTLYVSGGNASGPGSKADPVAPIYEFTYAEGLLWSKRQQQDEPQEGGSRADARPQRDHLEEYQG
jgi:hypothetical protein